MKILTIKRTHHYLTDGIFGTLDIERMPFCQTLELPWRDNKPDVSSIPPGEYLCNQILSPKRGCQVFELQNVPNRSSVEVHWGNSIYDIEGCILVGRAFGIVETKDNGEVLGVQESKIIFNILMAKLKNDPQIKLVIAEC